MTIQPNSAESSAQMAAQAFANARQNQTASNTNANAAATDSWSSLAVSESGDGGDMDAATADQLTQALTKSMFDNSAAALSAQSGVSSQTALSLLQ